jgi:hypothetical protein
LYDAQIWTLCKVDQKYLKILKCGAGEERRSFGPVLVGNNEVLHRVKDINIVHTINRSKAKWICQFLSRNIFLKQVIEGNTEGRIEVMEDEEEDMSSSWLALRKREDAVN